MATPATSQEVQNALEKTRNSIMGSMLTRGDVQSIISSVRAGILQDLHSLHAENKASLHQAVNHRDQVMIRVSSLEHTVSRVEQLLAQMLSAQSKTSDRIQSSRNDNSAYLFQRI